MCDNAILHMDPVFFPRPLSGRKHYAFVTWEIIDEIMFQAYMLRYGAEARFRVSVRHHNIAIPECSCQWYRRNCKEYAIMGKPIFMQESNKMLDRHIGFLETKNSKYKSF